MKRRDLILIALALIAALGLWLASQMMKGDAATVVVTIDGEEALRAPLDKDDVYTFEQEDGSVNILTVKDGYAQMTEANCRDGLCLNMGRTNTTAKTIVCLPHKLVVQMESEKAPDAPADEIDMVIQ